MSKAKLVGNLIDCIYRTVSDDDLREEIYNEFAAELSDKNFSDISFLDACTDDEVFWNVLRSHGMCDPAESFDHNDDEQEENEQLTIVDDSKVGLLRDDDDEDDYNPFDREFEDE